MNAVATEIFPEDGQFVRPKGLDALPWSRRCTASVARLSTSLSSCDARARKLRLSKSSRIGKITVRQSPAGIVSHFTLTT